MRWLNRTMFALQIVQVTELPSVRTVDGSGMRYFSKLLDLLARSARQTLPRKRGDDLPRRNAPRAHRGDQVATRA